MLTPVEYTESMESIEKIYANLNSSSNGLTNREAIRRGKTYGNNSFTTPSQNILFQFFSQFLSPFIIILFCAGAISAFLGDTTNFIIITIIIIVSGVIDFYQKYQAQTAVQKLRQKVSLTTSVLRDGNREEIPLSEVTIGDVVLLVPGDIVPADARLIEEKDLSIDQSALTGESLPQEKQSKTLLSAHLPISEQSNMVFMGTHVISGEAKAIVVQIGKQTELGKIAEQLVEKRPETEFNKGIRQFGYFLMKITFTLTVIVFFVNAFVKHDVLNSFLFALALAVSITPELLPVIITITLSHGAVRMSKKEIIVKDLPAIQNLGSMNVLCTDKTGTLTEGVIHLERYANVEGTSDAEVLKLCYVNSFFQTSLKSPIDESILHYKKITIDEYKKIDEIPYDFFRKRLSVVVDHDDKYLLIVKGAFEQVMSSATHYEKNKNTHGLTTPVRNSLRKQFEEASAQGYRVLMVAVKEIETKHSYTPKDETSLTVIGLLFFRDIPKHAVKEALQALERQQIAIKVLTGDNELVTKKVCEEIGLYVTGILTGEEIDGMNEESLRAHAGRTTIFAKLDPNHKKRVVNALRSQGNVVGFLGDGINDAPSLRAADVGISVNNAVDIAKESADLILLRKDLHVLKDGIYEGRKTYGNVMKYIMMSTSSNFGNMFSVAIGSLFLPFLPMLPIQILLNNLLYDTSQLFIPNDTVSREYLDRPHQWNITFIKEFMMVFGPLSSLIDFLTFFALLTIVHATVPLFQTGWFVESLVTQTLIIFSIRTSIVPFFRSRPNTMLIISACTIALVGILLPFSPLARIFFFVQPPLQFYSLLAVLTVIYFILIETTKRWFYRKYST